MKRLRTNRHPVAHLRSSSSALWWSHRCGRPLPKFWSWNIQEPGTAGVRTARVRSFSSTNTALETIATHHPVWCQSISASKTRTHSLGHHKKEQDSLLYHFLKDWVNLLLQMKYWVNTTSYRPCNSLKENPPIPPQTFVWTCQTKGKSCMKVPAEIKEFIGILS